METKCMINKLFQHLKLRLFIAFFILLYSGVRGQNLFQKSYGSKGYESVSSIKKTSDKGFVIAGTTDGFGAGLTDLYVIKTDSVGDTLWTRSYGGPGIEMAGEILQTPDGGYALAGYTQSFGAGYSDFYLLRLKANGDTLWTRTYGGSYADQANSISLCSDKGFVLAGFSLSFLIGTNGNAYIVKTDSAGTLLWSKVYGGLIGSSIYDIAATSDSGFVMVGEIDGYGLGGSEVYVIKTDIFGDSLWQLNYGGSGEERGYSISQTADTGFIIAASTTSFGYGQWDGYAIKLDKRGDTLWSRVYGSAHNEYFKSLTINNAHSFSFCGAQDGFAGDTTNFLMIKTDIFGDTDKVAAFGGMKVDFCNASAGCAVGGTAMAGNTSSFIKPNNKVYLLTTDSNGNSSCNKRVSQISTKKTPTHINHLHLKANAVISLSGATHTILQDSTNFLSNDCFLSGIGGQNSTSAMTDIFPNPAEGTVVLRNASFSEHNVSVQVFSSLGALVFPVASKQERAILLDFSNLPDGIFFIEIKIGTETAIKKLIHLTGGG